MTLSDLSNQTSPSSSAEFVLTMLRTELSPKLPIGRPDNHVGMNSIPPGAVGWFHVTPTIFEVSGLTSTPGGGYAVAEKSYVPAIVVVTCSVQVMVDPEVVQLWLTCDMFAGLLNAMVTPDPSPVPTAVTVTEFATVCVVGDAETTGGVNGWIQVTDTEFEVAEDAAIAPGA